MITPQCSQKQTLALVHCKCKSTDVAKSTIFFFRQIKAAPTFVVLHQLHRACGVIECSPRATLHPSVVSDPLLPNQLSPDLICFMTVLVGINDSGRVFHSSHCAGTAAGCCQTLCEAEGKLPSVQTPSLSWPERCWLSCLFALPGRIKCLLLRCCKLFYFESAQRPQNLNQEVEFKTDVL